MNSYNYFIRQFLAMSELYLRMTENDATAETGPVEYGEFNETVNAFTEFYYTTDQPVN